MQVRQAFASPPRFYSLDALRGVAALSVVFWHWQHFYFEGNQPSADFDASAQPLFAVFELLYRWGWLAVDFFFTLSGFIFCWLYTEKLSSREISGREFFLFRFSRLYPLHLLTLLLVAAGQWVFHSSTSTYFVYQYNDPYHFALNLGLASAWGWQSGYSFNAPVWSISVEVLLYLVFFIACRVRLTGWISLAGLACIGLAVLYTINEGVGRGFFSFFIGCLCYKIYAHCCRRGSLRRLAMAGSLLTFALWAMVLAASTFHFGLNATLEQGRLFCASLLFPATIVSLASIETLRGHLARRLAKLGDISYSSYLIHFPLELLFALVVVKADLPRSVFNSPITLGLFFLLLILFSLASFSAFERPLQRLLRPAGRSMPRTKVTSSQ